ncbi:MAG: ORF6N domain-containing protein [Planctomycetota bacterium]|nr:ORF6N domain-containing protein [Planctomycetota bacterium]
MKEPQATQLIPVEQVERLIHLVRGEKVLLDADLAMLYGVTTGNLNKAVKRNQQRFPPDFIFQLSDKETAALIFQSGRSNYRGGRRHNPYALSRQGSQHAIPREEKVTRPNDPDRPSGEHDGLYQIMRSDPLYRA